MKLVYKCDFCTETFTNEKDVIEHEKNCSYNPKNKFKNKTIINLADLLYNMNVIIAASISDIEKDNINNLIKQIEDINNENCRYKVNLFKNQIIRILRLSNHSKEKYTKNAYTTYENVLIGYPELLEAFKKVLIKERIDI